MYLFLYSVFIQIIAYGYYYLMQIGLLYRACMCMYTFDTLTVM